VFDCYILLYMDRLRTRVIDEKNSGEKKKYKRFLKKTSVSVYIRTILVACYTTVNFSKYRPLYGIREMMDPTSVVLFGSLRSSEGPLRRPPVTVLYRRGITICLGDSRILYGPLRVLNILLLKLF